MKEINRSKITVEPQIKKRFSVHTYVHCGKKVGMHMSKPYYDLPKMSDLEKIDFC